MRLLAAILPTIVSVCCVSVSAEERVPLLHISKGQLPNDTAQDNQSKLTIETAHKQLGGKALEVVFADGDAFGPARQ